MRAKKTFFLLIFLTAFTTPSLLHASPDHCDSAVSVTLQGANTFLEHAASGLNDSALPELRGYVPSAPAFTLDRTEIILMLNYEHRLGGFLTLRPYAGFNYSPRSVVYSSLDSGHYGDIDIGMVRSAMSSRGSILLTGTDLLLESNRCSSFALIGGSGFGVMHYRGRFDASFTPVDLSDRAFATFDGTYSGAAGYVNVFAGIRLNFLSRGELTILGGYRTGIGYIEFHSTLDSGTSPLPIYGPFFQISIGSHF
jgi:hypothetical protein